MNAGVSSPEGREELHRPRIRRIVAGAMAGLACGSSGIIGLDILRTKMIDAPDLPTTSVLDHDITWTPDPEQEAKLREVNPELVEKCRKSKFVVIHFSGTGMETSHYAANILQEVVEAMGGCSMYHWYGHVYDPEASAESVESAIEEVTPEGEKKAVVFIGASFGGIAAEDIANEPVLAQSSVVDIKKIVMLMSPTEAADVSATALGIPISWLMNFPVPEFGKLAVLASNIGSQAQQGQLFTEAGAHDAFTNAAKTRPILMRSELLRIQQGLQTVRPNLAVSYVASPGSDTTVNNVQAFQRLETLSDGGQVTFIEIMDGGHDRGWLVSEASKYNPVFKKILQDTFAEAA